MAQRDRLLRIPLSDPPTEVILRRIGFYGSGWELLEWFVDFAQKDLNAITQGEQEVLCKEVIALDMALLLEMTKGQTLRPGARTESEIVRPLPTFENLRRVTFLNVIRRIQRPVKHWLELALSSEERPVFGTVKILVAGVRFKNDEGQDSLRLDYHSGTEKGRALLKLVELLRQYPSSLSRCLHCNRIFLKVRKNARYCGRPCHSVAGMRKYRAKKLRGSAYKRRGKYHGKKG